MSRIVTATGARRVELYRRVRAAMVPAGRWDATWVAAPQEPPLPVAWFPWGLGNVRAREHLFVRNAGPLPLHPGDPARVGDLDLGSALHLPLRQGSRLVGAVCLYWAEERADWPVGEVGEVRSAARDVLARGSGPPAGSSRLRRP